MNIYLGEHFETFVREQVATGRYANASEVVREALRDFEEHEEYVAYVRAKVAKGDADIAAGRVVTVDDPKQYVSDLMTRTLELKSLKAAG